jgi:serralysin
MSFHLWEIREIYSGADGSIQFIELFSSADGQTRLGGQTLRFTEAGTGNVVEFFFPADLAGSTAGRSLLLGTPSYFFLSGVPDPDFVLPDNFLSFAGGTLEIVGGDVLTYGAGLLPADGTHSLVDLNAGGDPVLAVEVSSPTNFSGESGSIEAGSEIVGTEGDDSLVGTNGDDSLFGLGGNDTLDGGLGDDLLDGGEGIDTADYAAHFASIFADLAAGAVSDGFDTDTLVSIENLRGTQASDFLQGDAGANRLDGGDGDDFLAGGGGDDTLIGGPGIDQLHGEDGDDAFLFASGADYASDEQIHGGAGADAIRFTSMTAGDFLLLGPGFFSNDVTGIEIVMISDAAGDTSGTTPLGVNASIIRDNGVTIVGNDGDNFFLGGTVLADAIYGNGGDDVLHGGSGDDLLDGGAGSDTYASLPGLDPVTVNLAEGFALDGGGDTDTLAGIENADGSDNTDDTLIGDAGANRLRGMTGNDRLEGGAGADTLDGGAGADTMLGGSGDDTYVRDDAGDAIEERPNSGIDTVLSSVSTELGKHVEHLALTGTAPSGTGNRLDNVLTGNGAANVLRAMAGDDTLLGGPGNDVLSGGGGRDSFVFEDAPGPADADLVTDFRSGQDQLRLDDAAFAGIGALGQFAVDDERFAFGDGLSAGADETDRIVYDTSAGNLYYDADGSGAGAALLFATLQGAPGLNADDILVI